VILAFRKKEKIISAIGAGGGVRFKAPRTIILTAGLGLTAFALLGPQIFDGYTDVYKSGTDIYILIDTSKSMLVGDVIPDRLTVAKRYIENLINGLNGDRIGFIPFASDAYIQMPLTDDYQLALMFLNVLDTDLMSGGGTNLAAALRLANDSFNRASASDKVILIISDGEEHDGRSLDVVKSLTDTKVFAVGVGTEKGGLVPVYNDAGDTVVNYMKDAGGNPVTSRFNAETLKKLSYGGGGAYFTASTGNETAQLIEALNALNREGHAEERITRFNHVYQYFLGPGTLLVFIYAMWPESVSDGKRRWFYKKGHSGETAGTGGYVKF